jgi:hypothetical protein
LMLIGLFLELVEVWITTELPQCRSAWFLQQL